MLNHYLVHRRHNATSLKCSSVCEQFGIYFKLIFFVCLLVEMLPQSRCTEWHGGCRYLQHPLRNGIMPGPTRVRSLGWTADDCVWLLSVPDSPSKSKRPRDPGTKLVKSLTRERMPFAPLRTLLQQVYTRINLFVRTPFALIWNLLPSQPSAACQPREYPMQFGRHLARNCEALKAACSAKPIVPAELPCATEIFQSMAYGANAELWSFADLKSVFKYLRGGKALKIPTEWQELVPRSWPVAATASTAD